MIHCNNNYYKRFPLLSGLRTWSDTTHLHGSATVFKDDDESLWERAEFDPTP